MLGSRALLEEGILTALVAYGRLRPVPAEDDRLIGQREVLRANSFDQLVIVTIPEVCAPDSA